MPPLLSVSVMAHPSRAHYFDYLRSRLGDVPFAIDEKGEGVWPNSRRAWSLGLESDAEYHAVIQDDALVCKNFYQQAERVLQQVKGWERKFKAEGKKDELAVNFYFGKRRLLMKIGQQSLRRGYWMSPNPCWGVSLCLRREWIADMLNFCSPLHDVPQDDERIARWLRSHGRHTYFPVPSLVDHRHGRQAPSLIGDPGLDRTAYAFIDKR